MPEISFYLDSVDQKRFCDELFNHGATAVPDLRYQTASYEAVTNVEELNRALRWTRYFFIMHPSFTRQPLEVRRVRSGDSEFFSILPRNGGPAIDLLLSLGGEVSPKRVPTGMLGLYPSYWDLEGQTNMKQPSTAVSFFDLLKKVIITGAVCVRTKKRIHWIGQSTAQRARAGEIELVGLDRQLIVE